MNQPNGRCHPSLHPDILKAGERFKRRRIAQEEAEFNEMDIDRENGFEGEGDYAEEGFMEDRFRFSAEYSEAGSQNEDDMPMEDGSREDPDPQSSWDGPVKDFYDGAAETLGRGETFKDKFQQDKYKKERQTNLYYPFASAGEWELAAFINRSGLSLAKTDEFLKLQLVRRLCLFSDGLGKNTFPFYRSLE